MTLFRQVCRKITGVGSCLVFKKKGLPTYDDAEIALENDEDVFTS
jgi:hypothetical protein